MEVWDKDFHPRSYTSDLLTLANTSGDDSTISAASLAIRFPIIIEMLLLETVPTVPGGVWQRCHGLSVLASAGRAWFYQPECF